jgi:DNA-directed RNA polymerase specialized sigma24 family protein
VRLALRDGTESTQGKPPLEDRKNFVLANFERLDNKTMAEILDISVHTMRRLCHEYGLKRYGKKSEPRRKTA